VPYNYIPTTAGGIYEKELQEHLGCTAFTWQGFRHDESGVDVAEFQRQYRKYRENLGEIYSYPYLPLTEDEYRAWFQDATAPVKQFRCSNTDKLIDIQPQGDVNFCVDTPDYTFGNVRESTLEELWNGARAELFRSYRREKRLAACNRCVSKYMSEEVVHEK
jgi:MoaA/NifB/PqqE/SkfB family radical SAM enzyme